MTALVVGLGDPMAGDDAVGPVIATGIGSLALDGVDVLVRADPAGLLDVWLGYRRVVVVHAVPTGTVPGVVSTAELGAGAAGRCDGAWAGRGGAASFGISAAVELSRAMGRLPEQLLLVGVGVSRTAGQVGLSPMVFSALCRVQCAVLDLLQAPAIGAVGAVPVPRRAVALPRSTSAPPGVLPRPRRSEEPMSGAVQGWAAASASRREFPAGH
ncbi:MAG TPA: hydrogenase maturation protease [Polyangiaceae bacterium]|nr:hydrogenase maturation protease [Polyangiaceae bacterium]